jgi:hypothetical protein
VTIIACVLAGLYMFKDMLGLGGSAAPAPAYVAPLPTAEETAQATAQQSFEAKKLVLPKGEALPENFATERMKEVKENPFDDVELAYSFLVPKEWQQSNFARYGVPGQANYTILTNIARYFGPAIGTIPPIAWIEAHKLTRETTAEAYMTGYFFDRGITPEGVQIHNERHAEALFTAVEDRISYATRGTWIINGDTVVLLRIMVPSYAYSAMAQVMGVMANSFKLHYKILREIEPKTEGRLLNIASFKYLASWQLAQTEKSNPLQASIEIRNPSQGRGLDGLIFLRASKRNTNTKVEDLTLNFETWLNGRGYSLIKKTEPEAAGPELAERFSFYAKKIKYVLGINLATYIDQNDFGVVVDTSQLPQFEMNSVVLDNGNYVIHAALVTPPINTGYGRWAQNHFAFEQLLRSLVVKGALRLRGVTPPPAPVPVTGAPSPAVAAPVAVPLAPTEAPKQEPQPLMVPNYGPSADPDFDVD